MGGLDLIALGILAFMAVCVFFYALSGILKNASKMSMPALIIFVLIVLFACRWLHSL